MFKSLFSICFLLALVSFSAQAGESVVEKNRFLYTAIDSFSYVEANSICDAAVKEINEQLTELEVLYPEYDLDKDLSIKASVNIRTSWPDRPDQVGGRPTERFACELVFNNKNPGFTFRLTYFGQVQDEACDATFDRFLEGKTLLVAFTEQRRTFFKRRYRCLADSIELVTK